MAVILLALSAYWIFAICFTAYCVIANAKKFLKMLAKHGVDVNTNIGLITVCVALLFAIITSPVWLPWEYFNDNAKV